MDGLEQEREEIAFCSEPTKCVFIFFSSLASDRLSAVMDGRHGPSSYGPSITADGRLEARELRKRVL